MSKRKDIIKIRVKINYIETKKNNKYNRSMKPRAGSLKR